MAKVRGYGGGDYDDDEYDDLPPRRRRRNDDYEDDDDDYDDRPRRSLQPHRGGMILAFGLLGLLFCFIFGIMAWSMGKADLEEMRKGRMDPEGHGLTQAGYILGIITCIFTVLGLIGMVLYFVLIGALIAGN